ncbi:NAD(P)-dependent oxidoreductase [Amycolatopsis jejuensis]|uniref:NAD(P)-dependent oxidoreductase n=1 Tax=Amycolatopsis jejuensis TaxID=330084 RepID=UPI000524F807|nr:NAD(P)H-binding protein [Amycolatopsis jejuensis]
MHQVGIIGVSGKLGRYLAKDALDRGYEVVGVCRKESVGKLGELADAIKVLPGGTDDREVIREAVAGCDGVLTVLVPWGVRHYASGTAQAVLDGARPDARLVFSCGWHVPGHEKDSYSRSKLLLQSATTKVMRALRVMDIDDQVAAARRVYESSTQWTVVRASTLEEGESEGRPAWADHVGHPKLASDRTRRIDYARFLVDTLTDDALIRKAPAIVGCRTPSALAHER